MVALSVGGGGQIITVTPIAAEGSGATANIITNNVTASAPVSGGSWTWTYESGFAFTALAPASPSTEFLAEGLSPGEDRSGLFRVTLFIDGTPVAYRLVSVMVSRA